MSNDERMKTLRERVDLLNAVSPSFCLAKWAQSTTTLYNGYTHSCHHPVAHKIKVEDIQRNPAGLHNTPIKIVARADMLKGIQAKECDYCWNIENLGKDHFSDRHYKSANSGMGIWQKFDEILESGTGENFAPTYFEVAFENTCNFKCSYCSPDVSSRWTEECQQHGGYKLTGGHVQHNIEWLKTVGKFPIHHSEHNPYIEAFWKWWPELYKNLNTFRITGGEPLLSDNTWKVIDHIIADPRPEFKFGINTNMGLPTKMIEKLALKLNQMAGKVREIVIYTSAESVGPQAEYSRFGMDWELFTRNVRTLLEKTHPSVYLQFMTTVNVFSASTFDDFLRHVSALRKEFGRRQDDNRVGFGVAYLRWPFHQCLVHLDAEQKRLFGERMEAVIKELTWDPNALGTLYLEEVDQIRRMVNFMNSTAPDPKENQHFVMFFDEYDRRRGTKVLETFPELRAMYEAGQRECAKS